MTSELRYLSKLQLYLQSEASYLAALEKIEDNLRKIAQSVMATGDPFEVRRKVKKKQNFMCLVGCLFSFEEHYRMACFHVSYVV